MIKTKVVIYKILVFLLLVMCLACTKDEETKTESPVVDPTPEQTPEVVKYVVTFDVDGEKTIAEVKEGEKASKPTDPVKEGYTFIGWYIGDEELETLYDFEKTVTADVALVAKFEEVTYKVTFNVLGIEEEVKVRYNEKVVEPETPVKEGYDFIGWYVSDEGYLNLYDFETLVTSDIILFACFKELTPEIITSMKFTKDVIVLTEQIDIPIECEGIPQDLIEYTFDKNDIAMVKDNQLVALSTGMVKLFARYDDLVTSTNIYVFPVIENAIDYNSSYDLNPNFTYESLNSAIIKIDNGKMCALSAGTTKIIIRSNDGLAEIAYDVVVLGEKPIIICDKSILCIGDEIYIDVLNYDKELLSWNISNEEVVYLFEDFYASALGAGECVLTATTPDGVSSSVNFIVIEDVPRFAMQTEKVIVGNELELNITNDYTFEDVNIEYDKEFFELINEDVVYMKALKEGITTIKVSLKEYPDFYSEKELTIYSDIPVFNVENSTIKKGNKIKLDVVNYYDGYVIEVVNQDIALYEDGFLIGLKPGATEVKVYLESSPEKSTSIIVDVLHIMPTINAVMPNLIINGKTGFIITNISELDDVDSKNYRYSISDTSIASIDENGILTAIKDGEVLVTIRHKDNNLITGQTMVKVFKSEKDIPEDTIIVTLENVDGVLQAGEMFPTTLFGDYPLEKYEMFTSDDTVLMVNSKGNILAVNAGVAKVHIFLKSNSNIKTTLTVEIVGIPNTNYIGRLIKIAEEEIGYVEGPNNDTKYGDWYGLPNEEWCAMFVSWCAKEAGISTDIIPKYCGCTAGMNWFKERGIWQNGGGAYKPKPGDIIFFSGDTENISSHTGIVIAYDNGTVYTIEGNTSNMCAKRSYSIYSSYVKGYGTPNYPYYDGEIGSGNTGGATDGGGESTT